MNILLGESEFEIHLTVPSVKTIRKEKNKRSRYLHIKTRRFIFNRDKFGQLRVVLLIPKRQPERSAFFVHGYFN